MWSMLADRMMDDFRAARASELPAIERAVAAGELAASAAVDRLLG
jgi:hypothetical protein